MRVASLLFILLAPIGSSHAFEVSGNFWESWRAVFHVGISGSSPTGGTWSAAFIRAMDAWSDVSNFKFVAVNDYLDPCIDRGAGQFGDRATGVDFGANVCGTEFGENTLAVTLTAGQCLNLQCTGGFSITDADIVFNSAENWDVYSGPRRFDNTSEFERVALHELGHALGLNHSTASDAIMRPFVSDTNTLQIDDIAGIDSIYGGATVPATVKNIYGVTLLAPDNPTLSEQNNSRNLSGSLSSGDNLLDGKSLDLYQYTFENDSTVDIQLSSQAFDPFLYLVRVSSTQAAIADSTFTDDNSGNGNSARINRSIQAGTYWLGVSGASSNSQGSYEVSIISNTNTPSSSFESFTSIYGAQVLVNPNPNIHGRLESTDFRFDGKFLDLIQIDVVTNSKVKIDLSSSVFDTKLLLVEVNSDQSLGSLSLQNDDNGSGTDSVIETALAPGTYWLGVTSFKSDKSGDYKIAISLVLP